MLRLNGDGRAGALDYRANQGVNVRRPGAQSTEAVVSSSNLTATRTLFGSPMHRLGIRSDTGASSNMSAWARMPGHLTTRLGR